jgi:hypothetical protein
MEEIVHDLSEIVFIIVAIGIPAILILGRPFIRRWLDIREKQLEIGARTAAERSAQYVAHGERLEARLRVLEEIVTDRGAQTAAQIDALRDQPMAKLDN